MLAQELAVLEHWIRERESIRLKRLRGDSPPWTSDKLLARYRWCNVRRMDDKVSIWLLAWHRAHPEVSFRDRIVAALAGRLINWPDTLGQIEYPAPYNEVEWTDYLLARKAEGCKIFTGAYIINGALGGDKILQVTQKILLPIWRGRRQLPNQPSTMQEVWKALNGLPGIGSFMAGQAVADLRHIHPELPWSDRLSWAPPGPGSLRGINRLLGRPPRTRIANDEWLATLRLAHAALAARLPITFRRLELMDMQNVMCEYDKYQRLTLGEGSVRSKYRSHA
jgi:hypothetical protein